MNTRPNKEQRKPSEGLSQILVAGGAGFVGSHLCETLLSQNCFVYCLDNLTTGKKQNLKNFWDNDNFFFVQQDLNQPLDAKNFPQLDYVFHLAGIEAYINNQNISLETLLVNSLGTKNLLELAKSHRAKFLLGSSPKVYEGFLSNQELKDYFGKKPQSDGYYSYSEAKRFSEALTFEYFKTYGLNARIARIADIYGPQLNLQTGGEINELFLQLKEGKNLKLPGDGLKTIHPLYISDLIYGIFKAMFGQTTSGHIYTLTGPEEIPLVDFAKKLIVFSKKNLDIEYKNLQISQKNLIYKEEIIKTSQMLSWHPKVSLEEGITKTLDWLIEKEINKTKKIDNEKKDEVKPIKPKLPVSKKPLIFSKISISSLLPKFHFSIPKTSILEAIKHFKKLPKFVSLIKKIFSKKTFIFLTLFFLLIFIILSPAFFFCFNVYKGTKSLEGAEKYFKAYNFKKSKDEAIKARLFFQKTKKTLIEFSWLASGINVVNYSEKIHSLLQAGDSISQTIIEGIEAVDHANRLLSIVLKGESGSIQEENQILLQNLNQTYEQLSFLETSLKDNLQTLSAVKFLGFSERFSELEKNIKPTKEMIDSARQLLVLTPQILAFEGKKTYLVLLQNNMELRATGGFIGSYAFLTFEKGKLLDFKVEDVYTADGQLKGYVKPPEPIKKYLGEDIWYFRDSNFDPNFPTSAQQAEWFIQKELGRKVDGVIAINLSLAQSLLSVLGPIQLLDYKELINSDNVFERAEYYSEVNFFPGSTQKKDFLGALVTALFEKLKRIEEKQWIELTKVLTVAFEKKQILLYFHDSKTARLVNFRGWDGGIRQLSAYNLPSRSATILKDYLMVVESNFGVNKVNYFMKREVNQVITIHKTGEVNESLVINYENTSQSSSWPGGGYKNYLQVLMPAGVKLARVMAGENKESLKPISTDKIDNYFKYGKNVIGFLVEIPEKEKRLVKIDYQLGEKMDFTKKLISYAFFIQKQPGTKDDLFIFEINHPAFIVPLKVTPKAKVGKQLIKFSSDISRDQLFVIDFAQ